MQNNLLKAKTKTKLDVMLTATTPGFTESLADQAQIISGWSAAAMTMVFGPVQQYPDEAFGIRTEETATDSPTLREMFGSYFMTIPGGSVVGIALPKFTINGDFSQLLKHVESFSMVSWAAKVDTGFYVMWSPIIAHFLNEIPLGLEFSNPDWTTWMEEWLRDNVRNRFFDASSIVDVSIIPDKPKLEPVELSVAPATENALVAKKKAKSKQIR